MRIGVGCPIFEREWCLPRWFQCLFNQRVNPKNIDLVFAYTPGTDATMEIIEKYGSKFGSLSILDCADLPAFKERDNERFFPLVILRNRIIDKLREIQPDFYFSYDSDIIIPEGCLKTLIKDNKDIVGPWLDLVPPGLIPNCASIEGKDGFVRRKPYALHYPQSGLYKVDTVFAAFLMKNEVFNSCTYAWHPAGEDFGWALDVRSKGFESWMNGDIIANHLYRKDI